MINFQVSIASHKKIQLPTNTDQTNLGDISRCPRLWMPPSQVIPRHGPGLQLRLGHEITIAPLLPWSPAVLESAFTFYCQLLKLALCDAVSICAQNFPALVCWCDLQMEYATHPNHQIPYDQSTAPPYHQIPSSLIYLSQKEGYWHGTRQEYQIQTTPVIKPVPIWNISDKKIFSCQTQSQSEKSAKSVT